MSAPAPAPQPQTLWICEPCFEAEMARPISARAFDEMATISYAGICERCDKGGNLAHVVTVRP